MRYVRVYEHRSLRTDRDEDGFKLTDPQLKRLQEYHGEKGTPFFTLINNGVKFCEYVGVLQVGELTIEVLPKTDAADNKDTWQSFLISMLRTVGVLDIEQAGYASLKLKSNSILDLYLELFLKEVKYLMQTGLIKKYRKNEGNCTSLKGSLLFSKHIQQNITHAERFYVRYSTYNSDNIFNTLLHKTVKLICVIGIPEIAANAQSVLLNFPDCKDIPVTETTFSKLVFDRKTESYRKAINIARLLLLNYHPDIRSGQNNVIALMFNMNALWEKYVYKLLRKKLVEGYSGKFYLKEQIHNEFWKPSNGQVRIVKPDIVVYDAKTEKPIRVLDTKWKMPKDNKPDDNDLKQMLVYNLYNNILKSALLYPGNQIKKTVDGSFQTPGHGDCSMMFLPLENRNNSLELQLSELMEFITV